MQGITLTMWRSFLDKTIPRYDSGKWRNNINEMVSSVQKSNKIVDQSQPPSQHQTQSQSISNDEDQIEKLETVSTISPDVSMIEVTTKSARSSPVKEFYESSPIDSMSPNAFEQPNPDPTINSLRILANIDPKMIQLLSQIQAMNLDGKDSSTKNSNTQENQSSKNIEEIYRNQLQQLQLEFLRQLSNFQSSRDPLTSLLELSRLRALYDGLNGPSPIDPRIRGPYQDPRSQLLNPIRRPMLFSDEQEGMESDDQTKDTKPNVSLKRIPPRSASNPYRSTVKDNLQQQDYSSENDSSEKAVESQIKYDDDDDDEAVDEEEEGYDNNEEENEETEESIGENNPDADDDDNEEDKENADEIKTKRVQIGAKPDQMRIKHWSTQSLRTASLFGRPWRNAWFRRKHQPTTTLVSTQKRRSKRSVINSLDFGFLRKWKSKSSKWKRTNESEGRLLRKQTSLALGKKMAKSRSNRNTNEFDPIGSATASIMQSLSNQTSVRKKRKNPKPMVRLKSKAISIDEKDKTGDGDQEDRFNDNLSFENECQKYFAQNQSQKFMQEIWSKNFGWNRCHPKSPNYYLKIQSSWNKESNESKSIEDDDLFDGTFDESEESTTTTTTTTTSSTVDNSTLPKVLLFNLNNLLKNLGYQSMATITTSTTTTTTTSKPIENVENQDEAISNEFIFRLLSVLNSTTNFNQQIDLNHSNKDGHSESKSTNFKSDQDDDDVDDDRNGSDKKIATNSSKQFDDPGMVPFQFKRVCYYLLKVGNLDVNQLELHICSHLIIGYARISMNGLAVPERPEEDAEQYRRSTLMKFQFPELKVLISIGDLGGSMFSIVTNNSITRERFILSIMELCMEFDFDGVDIDWEFPSINTPGSIKDRKNLIRLIKELRLKSNYLYSKYSKSDRFIISVAVGAPIKIAKSSYIIKDLGK